MGFQPATAGCPTPGSFLGLWKLEDPLRGASPDRITPAMAIDWAGKCWEMIIWELFQVCYTVKSPATVLSVVPKSPSPGREAGETVTFYMRLGGLPKWQEPPL